MGSVCSNARFAVPLDPPSRSASLPQQLSDGDCLLFALLPSPNQRERLTKLLAKSEEVRRSADWTQAQALISERYEVCTGICVEILREKQKLETANREIFMKTRQWAEELHRENSDFALGLEDSEGNPEVVSTYLDEIQRICHLKGEETERKLAEMAQITARSVRRQTAMWNSRLFLVAHRLQVAQIRLYFLSWRQNSAPTPTSSREIQTDVYSSSFEIALSRINREVENHIQGWKSLLGKFAEGSVADFQLFPHRNDGEESLEQLGVRVKAVLEATRKSAQSALCRLPVSPIRPVLSSPCEEMSPFGRNYMKENAGYWDNVQKYNAGNRSAKTPVGDTAKLTKVVAEKDAEIARLASELDCANEELRLLREKLSSLQSVPAAPPSPPRKLTISIPESQEALKAKALKSVLTQSNSRFLSVKRLSFVTWAYRTACPRSGNQSVLEDSLLVGDLEANASRIEGEIREIHRETLAENVLLQVRDRKMKLEKASNPLQLLKFFEELMGKKYECDQMDLKNNRCPKSIPVFIMEYLTRMFGLRKLAIKTVNQILPTLEALCRDGQQFAVLFAQLAQVFHPNPVSYLLSLFLTRKMIEFEEFSVKKDWSTPTKDMKPYSFTGGDALLSDIIPLAYSLFESDRCSGQHLIRLLKPQNVSQQDFVLFHVGIRLSKIAINPDNLFGLLEGSGNSESAFVAGLRRALDIWVTSEELKSALKSVVGASASICKATISQKVNHRMYQKYTQSGEFVVSKYTFLQGLIEVYMANERKYIGDIKAAAGNYSPEAVSYEDFCHIVRRIDPAVASARLSFIFQKVASGRGMDASISFRSLAQGLLRYPIGDMAKSVFCEVCPKEVPEVYTDSDDSFLRSQPASPCFDSASKFRLGFEPKCRTPIPFQLDKALA